MTEIEKKALALAIETREEGRYRLCPDPTLMFGLWEALCRAIEQHEAFRQEVSDAVVAFMVDKPGLSGVGITRFIIAKPDPLVEALEDMKDGRAGPTTESYAACLRAALAKRNGRIVFDD